MYVSLLKSDVKFPEQIPATIESLTLRAVLAMSISGSTLAISPTICIGRPIVPKTMRLAKVAPPPTPATPKLLITTIAIRPATHMGSNTSMPIVGAIRVAIIAG